jgi:hypothetical protein
VRAGEEDLPEMPGQDAFLDVLTNMVGIIIMLVVIMGIRSSRAATASSHANKQAAAAAATEAANAVKIEELEKTYRSALQTRGAVEHLMDQAVGARRETLIREQERQYLATYVTAFSQELEERRQALTAEEQRDFDLRQALAKAQSDLDDLTREQVTLLSQPTEAEVLENHPTPIRRQLSEKELFLQLSGEYVAVIPFADLIEEFKLQARENIWRLKNQDRFSGTVGPIGGYRLKYYVQKRIVEVDTPAGKMQQGAAVEVGRLILLPEEVPPGDQIDEALQPNSDFLAQLKSFSPESTTISIAVYPDSVRTLHRLKKVLHQMGYGVAEMLIPQGQPVMFSPNGEARYAQ